MNAVLKPTVVAPAFPAVNGELLDEKAMLDLLGDPVHQGACDLCGRWDSNLVRGIGSCCAESTLVEKAVPKRNAGIKFLPSNAHFWKGMTQMMAALIELNESRCLVERIECGSMLQPTIHLARSPGEGLVASRQELFVGTGVHRQRVMRADFCGCTLQWMA